jgi:M6 family metalloprotease-like protein
MLTKKTLRNALLALLLGGGIHAYAAPAYPGPITHTNPDGSTVTIRLHGDEHLHFATTEDGYLVKKGDDGFYHYATVAEGKVTPTRHIVSTGDVPEEIRRLDQQDMQNRLIDTYAEKVRVKSANKQKTSINNITEERTKDIPTKGVSRFPVILVDYPDKGFTHDKQQFNDWLMKEGYDYTSMFGTAKGSVRDYYLANSNGQLDTQFEVYGPVTATHEHDYYGYSNGDERCLELMVEIVKALGEREDFDFSRYDNDNDGTVDIVYVVHAGADYCDTDDDSNIWAQSWSVYGDEEDAPAIIFNGKKIDTYGCSAELYRGTTMNTIGIFCHEFAHTLGLCDHYDITYSGFRTPGYWDIMSQGSYLNEGNTPPLFSAYERAVMGWSSPQRLQTTGDYSLLPPAVNYDSSFIIPTDRENEYYIFENRQQTEWDYYLPYHGMLVWHIDYDADVWTDDMPNSYEHQHVDLVEAGGVNDYDESNTPFPGRKNVSSFTDTTNPSMAAWSGKHLNTPITDIKELSDGSVSFHFENNSTGVDSARSDAATAVSVNGLTVTITAPEGTPVAIFALDGSMVASYPAASSAISMRLPAHGVYLVKSGDSTLKILAK